MTLLEIDLETAVYGRFVLPAPLHMLLEQCCHQWEAQYWYLAFNKSSCVRRNVDTAPMINGAGMLPVFSLHHSLHFLYQSIRLADSLNCDTAKSACTCYLEHSAELLKLLPCNLICHGTCLLSCIHSLLSRHGGMRILNIIVVCCNVPSKLYVQANLLAIARINHNLSTDTQIPICPCSLDLGAS